MAAMRSTIILIVASVDGAPLNAIIPAVSGHLIAGQLNADN